MGDIAVGRVVRTVPGSQRRVFQRAIATRTPPEDVRARSDGMHALISRS